mmetsp:Transcript_15164/g.32507  ORF Transcript_15164/g.32507 Transcript_15164/m.32507 type:complete len:242 (-) Transcript_15164:1100-1825(-)
MHWTSSFLVLLNVLLLTVIHHHHRRRSSRLLAAVLTPRAQQILTALLPHVHHLIAAAASAVFVRVVVVVVTSELERGHELFARFDILKHRLHFGRVNHAALALELQHKRPLRFVRGASRVEQPLAQVLNVIPPKHILILQEPKQRHCGRQPRFQLILRHGFQLGAQLLVEIQRQVLRNPVERVHKLLKRLVHHVQVPLVHNHNSPALRGLLLLLRGNSGGALLRWVHKQRRRVDGGGGAGG